MAFYGWNTINEIETRITAIEGQLAVDLSRLEGTARKHETRLDDMEAILGGLAITLGNHQRDIDAATSAVQDLDSRVDDVTACARNLYDLLEGFASFTLECSILPLS